MSDENNEDFDGITDVEADAALEDVLLKATKAKDNDDDDKDDDMNDAYMKKNMKKFMKKNPEYMKRMFGDPKGMGKRVMKKADDFGDAFTEVEHEIDGEAQIISLDGTKFFKAFKEMGDNLIESFNGVADRLEEVSEKLDYGEELQKAVGAVQLEIHKAVKTFGALPKPRTSQVTAEVLANTAALQKARLQAQPVGQEGLVQDEQTVTLLQKAMTMDQRKISMTLQKAAIKNNEVIDVEAAKVLSRFESGGLVRLGKADLQYVIDKVISPQVITAVANQPGGIQ